jgi:TolB-like protein/Tfp pilus assembly protein PilF
MTETSFYQELIRRRVIRVLSVYSASAFVILQIADVTFEPLGLPDWSMRVLIVLLSAGAPVAAILSWIFDITPEGVVRTGAPQTDEIERLRKGRKVDVVVIISLLVIIATLVGKDYIEPAQKTPVFTVSVDKSVAVLPFVSFGSSDESNYFAEGLSVELINTLSMIQDIRVASSNSSMLLGREMSDTEIGESLKVAHLVKGTVRKAGNTTRVNVQVIRVSDSTLIMSRIFEKSGRDVFALQDDISSNIAISLKSTLYIQALEQIGRRTDSADAYDAYLLALYARRNAGWSRVLEHAKRAVDLDPNFVAAYTLAARAYLTRVGGTVPAAEAYPQARRMVSAALAIDADFAPAIMVQAHLERVGGDYVEAERLFRRAKTLAPGMATQDLANLLMMLGRSDEALEEYRRSYDQDPVSTTFFARALIDLRLFDEAKTVIESRIALSQPESVWFEYMEMARLYLQSGNMEEANRYIDLAIAGSERSRSSQQGTVAYILYRLGRFQEATRIHELMLQRAQNQYVSPIGPFIACVGLRDDECAFQWLDKIVAQRAYLAIVGLKTSPIYRQLRKDPRFDYALDRLGLL